MSALQEARKEPTFYESLPAMSLGVYVYAVGSIAAGVLDLVWGEFEAAHQPIQAWGDSLPGRDILAYLAAFWLIVAGAALLWRRTIRIGARALVAIYLLFAVFWLPRFYTAPHALGFRVPLLLGLLTGVGQQLILVGAAELLYSSVSTHSSAWRSRARLLVRWTFGLSSLAFGGAHLTGVREVAALVPPWLPGGGAFWAILTGVAFVLAGIAILTEIMDVLAARLLSLMLFLFSVLVLAPAPLAHPHNHIAWGSNAYNLAAVGAVWIFAESIANLRRERANEYVREESRLETKLAGWTDPA